jgi:SAM-dependent methyltransferase
MTFHADASPRRAVSRLSRPFRAVQGRISRGIRKLVQRPRVGRVAFGDLGGTTPISRKFGVERGKGIDRLYIERFLATYASDIRGHVLEVADRRYTERFGGTDITKCDVLHVRGAQGATIVGNLETGDGIPIATFDAIILTQTLQFIYEVRNAIRVLHRSLAPGGVLLATVPGISHLSRYDADRWGEFWRFTRESLDRLLAERFRAENVEVRAHGNVKAAVGVLHGLSREDLPPEDLDVDDPDYEVIITGRAVR